MPVIIESREERLKSIDDAIEHLDRCIASVADRPDLKDQYQLWEWKKQDLVRQRRDEIALIRQRAEAAKQAERDRLLSLL